MYYCGISVYTQNFSWKDMKSLVVASTIDGGGGSGDSGGSGGSAEQLRTFAQIMLLGKDGIRAMLTQKRTAAAEATSSPSSVLSTLPLERCMVVTEGEEEAPRETKLQWAMQSYIRCAVLRRTRRSEKKEEITTLADVRRLQEIQLLEDVLKKL